MAEDKPGIDEIHIETPEGPLRLRTIKDSPEGYRRCEVWHKGEWIQLVTPQEVQPMPDYVDSEQSALRYVRDLEQYILEMEAALIKLYEEVDKDDSFVDPEVILEIVKPAMKGALRAGEEIRKHQIAEGLRSPAGAGEVEDVSSQNIERSSQEI